MPFLAMSLIGVSLLVCTLSLIGCGAGAAQTNLLGGPLRPCSTSKDEVPAGIFRSGACDWDPDDGGFHAVCVTMTEKFLEESARYDGNDLSSVVQPGGHWCICAWAWASAVTRDPSSAEGLQLNCDATNGNLRKVYKHFTSLAGPTGLVYESAAALHKVDELCGDPALEMSSFEGASESAPGLHHSHVAPLIACAAVLCVTTVSVLRKRTATIEVPTLLG